MEPSVFIGSSTEGKRIARAIQKTLESDRVAEVTPWYEGVFGLSQSTLRSLIEGLDKSSFGIFVVSPEDVVEIEGEKFLKPCDNVIFELGLFIGRLGQERTYMVVPHGGEELQLPTDLAGITYASFDANPRDNDLLAALEPACEQIRKSIERLETESEALEASAELIEKSYDEEIYQRCEIYENKVKQILIQLIVNSDRAKEFPNQTELASESFSDVHTIAQLADVGTAHTVLGFLFRTRMAIFGQWERKSVWEQQKVKRDLDELEEAVADWEKKLGVI